MADITPALACIRDTGTEKGLGVFASRDIGAGELVEMCPVIIFPADWGQMPQSVKTRVFAWGVLSGLNQPKLHALALGWGCMYNHANPANLRYVANVERELMAFVAARSIDAGEELTINYNYSLGEVSSSEDNWFESTGVTLITS